MPATLESVRAALRSSESLGRALGARVTPTWPHDELDEAVFHFMQTALAEQPDGSDWWMYFVILRDDDWRGPVLVGSAGYKGPPDENGEVEIGYGIVEEYRRRGLASEAARGLVDNAFRRPDVTTVVAETLVGHEASIAILTRCGFRPGGRGSGPGLIRFERRRDPPEETRQPCPRS